MKKSINKDIELRHDMTLAELVIMLSDQLNGTGTDACQFEIPGYQKIEGRLQPVRLSFDVRLQRVQ